MPTVSVIIPTYNREKFLPDAIKSVLEQTYNDFELIIVNDGSTDNTQYVVKQFHRRNIRYYYQNNKGVSAARNNGIKKAKGKFLCFLDSDDYWLPKKLARQITFAEENSPLHINQTDEVWIRKERRVNPMKKHMKHAGMIYEKCLPLCLITPSSVMIERNLLSEVGLFDETLPACEDYDLWLRIAYKYSVGLIREKLIVKRGGHPDQLSHAIPTLDRFRIQAMLNMLNRNCLNKKQHAATIKELKKKCHIYGNGCMKHGKIEEGEHYYNLYKNFI